MIGPSDGIGKKTCFLPMSSLGNVYFLHHSRRQLQHQCCFFFQSRLVGNHSQEDLAKFGYTSERALENFKNKMLYFDDMLQPIVKIWRLQIFLFPI